MYAMEELEWEQMSRYLAEYRHERDRAAPARSGIPQSVSHAVPPIAASPMEIPAAGRQHDPAADSIAGHGRRSNSRRNPAEQDAASPLDHVVLQQRLAELVRSPVAASRDCPIATGRPVMHVDSLFVFGSDRPCQPVASGRRIAVLGCWLSAIRQWDRWHQSSAHQFAHCPTLNRYPC